MESGSVLFVSTGKPIRSVQHFSIIVIIDYYFLEFKLLIEESLVVDISC